MNELNLVELLLLYPSPTDANANKELSELNDKHKSFISKSPFVIISSSNETADVSPRGGAVGFVYVKNSTTLYIPDYNGNHRLDTLKNILENPLVGLLFLVPGSQWTLRVNGTAKILINENVKQLFDINGKLPLTVLEIAINECFYHCPKSMMRANLW